MQCSDLPDALEAGRRELDDPRTGLVSFYQSRSAGEVDAPPLLLIHSINAAAAAHEVRPLFDGLRGERPVFAPDLPGYGLSDRAERPYRPRLMTDAVLAVAEEARRSTGAARLDALAVSLSSEFLARAAVEVPGLFRSIALVSPTGFNRQAPLEGPPGATRGRAGARRVFAFNPVGRPLYRLLTTRPSIRFFLRKTFGSPRIDEQMFEYCCLTTRCPGAWYAPFDFLSGFLFSADSGRLYRGLACPVWMSHGVRGDFTDYRLKPHFAGFPNWRFTVYESGALPYFEEPRAFLADYRSFLASAAV